MLATYAADETEQNNTAETADPNEGKYIRLTDTEKLPIKNMRETFAKYAESMREICGKPSQMGKILYPCKH